MLQNLSNQGVPYVLCPMHKSHIDYLLLSYVCFAYHIFPPHVISGENLNIPLVGPVLSWRGGVFIRREFGQDDLYKAIFNEYVAQLLLLGHNLECFIEGARSRTGKLKNPKTGFLSVLVDIIASGRLEKDIALIPIAISYDKVIEGATFVNEMLGAKKQKESLTGLINSLNHVIRLNFGSIDISICQPISLRSSLPSPSSSFIGMAANDKRRIIKAIAYNVMYSMNLRLVISPTAMVATVLLTQLNRGIPRKAVIEKTEWIKNQVILRGGSVAHIFTVESTPKIVDRALKVLSKVRLTTDKYVYQILTQYMIVTGTARPYLMYELLILL
jgi:glycerol-3-phosphate O-acyltransferase